MKGLRTVEGLEEAILEYLKANLSLDSKTTSEYVGCGDGPLYKDYTTIRLMLAGDCIGEVTVNG